VSSPGTIGWFARHEARLAWRDWVSLMTGGSRWRARGLAAGFVVVAIALHGIAYLTVAGSAHLTSAADRSTLALVTGTLLMAWSLMLSQAMESVTRAFYARGDLELILCSPAQAPRIFSVRVAATVVTILLMMLLLAAPFIHVLAWFGGARWFGGYAVVAALAMDAVAVALVLTVALFRAIGPRRTRIVAQIVAAVVGSGFAIGMQFAAIVSYLDAPGLVATRFALLERFGPASGSVFWWPARALLGEPTALFVVVAASAAALAVAIRAVAPRFGPLAVAAGSVPHARARGSARAMRLRSGSPARALRRKEWMLLWRDPWLVSQSLMQLLYLLPAAYLLWRSVYAGGGASPLVVPILVVAAGQLGGGLAWLAVSGEDAPDLVASAPVSAAGILRAKAQAVLGVIAMIFGPMVVVLGAVAPFAGLVALAGIVVAAGSATAIQYWFRTQAKRSLFRRRQTSSRVANYAEALSSIGWAGAGALAAAGSWLAVVPGAIAVATLACARLVSPAGKPPSG